MRRTAAVTAALIAAASIALTAPAARAVPASQRLAAVVSCDGGGQVRLVDSVDAAGTQHGNATVRGVKEKRWAGELVLGHNAGDLDAAIDDTEPGMTKYVAKHGGFTTSAQLAGSKSPNAMGMFASNHARGLCFAGVMTMGDNRLGVTGMGEGLVVRTGPKPLIGVFALGQQHHRYRFAFAVRTKAGVKRWTIVRTATHKSRVQAAIRDAKHLPSFSTASVSITDLAMPGESTMFKLIR